MKTKLSIIILALFTAACSSVCSGNVAGIQGCPVYSYGFRSERCIIPQDLINKLDQSGHKSTIAVKGMQCHAQVYINQQQPGDTTPVDLNWKRSW